MISTYMLKVKSNMIFDSKIRKNPEWYIDSSGAWYKLGHESVTSRPFHMHGEQQ